MMSHQGSCHCGAVKYEVSTPIEKAIQCNCSICSRKGYLLAFVDEDQFKLLQGSDTLSDYQFGKKLIHHQFCKNCGAATFGHGSLSGGKKKYAVNVRCLENFDLKSLTIDQFDGKRL